MLFAGGCASGGGCSFRSGHCVKACLAKIPPAVSVIYSCKACAFATARMAHQPLRRGHGRTRPRRQLPQCQVPLLWQRRGPGQAHPRAGVRHPPLLPRHHPMGLRAPLPKAVAGHARRAKPGAGEKAGGGWAERGRLGLEGGAQACEGRWAALPAGARFVPAVRARLGGSGGPKAGASGSQS